MIPKVSPVKVIGYVRVSKVGSRGGERFRSPKEQRDAISALAEKRGFEVFRWLEELDASGGDDKRPRWNEARRAVERGEAAGVIVYDFSRWSRDTERGLASIRIMREAGGDLWSCQEQIDTTTPEGWFMLTSFLANATLQREMAGRRFRAAAESAVVRGVYMAGRVALGYVRDAERHLTPDPQTRDLVVGTFERRAKGWSWVRLARWLADQATQ
jgi:DNA invertase Pin-like site-specific DNA recombinase